MKDLVALAKAFNQKTQKPQQTQKKSTFTRPEYQTIAEAPTMVDVVKIINNHPHICNKLAAHALTNSDDYKTTQPEIEAHADRLLKSGAKFNKKRVVRIVLMSIKEGIRLN